MENREQQQPVPDEDEADAEMMEVEPQPPQQQLAANHQVEMETSVLSAILGRINVRMLLSNEERSRALAIRAAIAADATLENLSDMMYAQLALIDGDNLQDAVGRVRHLQQFREEYNIKDNFTQAQDISKRFLKAHRGHMLSISYNAMEGNYVAIYDQACLDTSSLRHDRDWELFLAYGWYLYHALSPDLHAIRHGIIVIAECEGLDWKVTDISAMQRVWRELLVAYPVSFREFKFFHTGVCATLTAALLKQILPERIHGKFNLGCQFDGRLDTYYRIPNEDEADNRVQAELEYYLKLRYENEKSFTLD